MARGDGSDFRAGAVAASESRRRGASAAARSQLGVMSSCLPSQPDLSYLRARIKVIACVSAIVGLSGLVAGGVIGAALKQHMGHDPRLPVIAGFCMIGGILMLFVPTMAERRIVRAHLSERPGNLTDNSESAGIHVSVEEAQTYGGFKLLAEDVGFLYVFFEARCIKIDGLSFEYVICSDDVVSLSLHRNQKSVLITYQIGDEQLDLAVVPRSVRAELKRQTMGASQSLYDKIRLALEPLTS